MYTLYTPIEKTMDRLTPVRLTMAGATNVPNEKLVKRLPLMRLASAGVDSAALRLIDAITQPSSPAKQTAIKKPFVRYRRARGNITQDAVGRDTAKATGRVE